MNPDASHPDLKHILTSGVIAVVRLNEKGALVKAAEALTAGGVGSFEITLTTPGAVDAVRELAAANLPGCLVGAGTVLDAKAANEVIDAGARFVVSPTFDEGMVRCCLERNVVCMPGTFTPTEILTAYRAGAQLIKVYPSSNLGPDFFRNILQPLPFLPLVPSGGMTLANAPEWIRAGAVAVSIAAALVDPLLVKNQAWEELTALGRQYVDSVAHARREVAGKRR